MKFYDDYSLMMSEAKTKATEGTGNTKTNALKISNNSCTGKSRQ